MRIQVDDDVKQLARESIDSLNTIGSAAITIAGALNRLNTTLRQRNGQMVTAREEFEANWLETPSDLSFQAWKSTGSDQVTVLMSKGAYEGWKRYVEMVGKHGSEKTRAARR